MRKITSLIILMFLVSLTLSAYTEVDDDLLKKTLAIAKKNEKNRIPGTKLFIEKVFTKNGELKKSKKLELQYFWDENNEKIGKKIEKALDNEEKLSISEAKEQFEDELKADVRDELVFFLNKRANNPQLEALGKTKKIEGKTCQGYEFQLKKESDEEIQTESGILWIDEKSGKLLMKESTVKPLPKMIKKMNAVTKYKYEGDKIVRKETDIEVDVSYLLVIKLDVKLYYVLSDFWEPTDNR